MQEWLISYFSLALDLSNYNALNAAIVAFTIIHNCTQKWFVDISRNSGVILDIPPWLQTEQFYYKVMQINTYVMQFIDLNFMKPEQYLDLAKNDAIVTSYIPVNIFTPQFCMELVKKNHKVVRYMVDNVRRIMTKEAYLYSVNQDAYNFRWVNLYGVDDDDIRIAALKKDGIVLQFIPIEFRTYEMCLEAVKSNPKALELVPPKLMIKGIL